MRIAGLLAALTLLSACAPAADPAPEAPSSEAPVVGMANPASVDCGRKGGESVSVDTEEGQVGVCVFPDGRRCEEWALFRDQRCVPGPTPAAPPKD